MLVGYARVSTLDQNLDLQIDALEKAGCEKIFTDKMSGAKTRPGLDEALTFLRPEDVLVVWKLDRLGRRTVKLLQLIEALKGLDHRVGHFRPLRIRSKIIEGLVLSIVRHFCMA
jgi:DNA invertase Pin-like site-specific DNA recombinase